MLTRDTLLRDWPEPAEVVETHVSLVVLTADRAYKFKKAVELPFLDLRDAATRERLCHEEVRLNAELCPDTYLGVVRVTREDGKLRAGGGGELVEHAVEMRRLPQDRMVDELMERGKRDDVAGALSEIVDVLADFHAKASRAQNGVEGRFFPVLELAGEHLPAAWARAIRKHVEEGLAARKEQFARRAADGFVVDGHGDLHAANICLAPEGVRIYDRLEFDRDMRCGDVAFDLSFLAMSLDFGSAPDLGRELMRSYAERTDDDEFEGLCRFFRVQRALVRGNVAGMRGDDPKAYDRLATGYAVAPAAVLLCGLPATGKSTRARELARPLCADVVATDVVRREITGHERWDGGFDEGPYRPDVTDAVYARVAEKAAHALDAGRSVIVDATLAKAAHRAMLIDAAGDRPWALVHVVRDEAAVERNLAAREERPDASDAGRAEYEEVAKRFEEPSEVARARVVRDEGGEVVDAVLDALAG